MIHFAACIGCSFSANRLCVYFCPYVCVYVCYLVDLVSDLNCGAGSADVLEVTCMTFKQHATMQDCDVNCKSKLGTALCGLRGGQKAK